MNNFSKNLRHLRAKYNYTQNDMKILFGIGNTTWSHYENGKSQPSIESLINISKFFGITLNELIVEDLSVIEMRNAKKQRPDSYAMAEINSRVEEKSALNYIVRELRKLRSEMDEMKEAVKK
ncbi:MAG TPA: helix-turn-helix transcriptional regulator [Chitinophagaceae bacterium]